MRSCRSCLCPASDARARCAFCDAPIDSQQPVAFALERRANSFCWITDDAEVASAWMVDGLWQLHDARGSHVVTLVPFGDGPGVALVGPEARLIGRVRPREDGGSMAVDPQGRPLLMLRPDGSQAAHLVDRQGDVVAVASWEDPDAPTDLLVTAHGIGQSLALVFGMFLSLELERHARRAA